MAGFTSLTANLSTMKAENFLSTWDDADLTALEYEASLQKLQLDVQIAKNISQSDTSTLDTIADLNSQILNMALTYIQLMKYYYNQNDGVDSLTFFRFEHFQKEYNSLKSNFGALLIRDEYEVRQTICRTISYG